MKKYKLSKYNKIIQENNKVYIYNSISGGLGEIDANYKELFTGAYPESEIINEIKKHKNFLNQLKEGLILIEQDFDELSYLRFLHSQMRYGNYNSFGLTLVPTNACNCRCPYCFEKDAEYPIGKMSELVQTKIIDYIDERISENGKLNISWFGGEPLLAIDTIKNMMIKINEFKIKKNLNIYSFMVTNGVLLDEKNVKDLIDMGIKNMQVTLDGPQKIHDAKRALKNGKGTYETILNNLVNCDEEIKISLRVNVDRTNAQEIQSLFRELKSVGLDKKKNINLYYSMIKDYSPYNASINSECFTTEEYADMENKLHVYSEESGFSVNLEPSPNIGNCGAISPYSIVVEADGTLQKCWNAVGDKSKSVGNILDINTVMNGNLIKWLGWNPLDNEKCVTCKELPLCYGGCPYQAIYGNKKKGNYRCNPIAHNIINRLQGVVTKG